MNRLVVVTVLALGAADLANAQSESESSPRGPAPSAATSANRGRLVSWILEGRFLDDAEVIRGFLEPELNARAAWTEDDQAEVRSFLRRLGYHSAFRNDPVPGGVQAVMRLEPITLVRRVKIDLDIDLVDRARHPIFADEVAQRMTLRSGSLLAFERKNRKQQLEKESARLKTYLRNDGFYEATVAIKEKRSGAFASEILVDIAPGPAYFVGIVNVRGNTAIPTSEISKMFRHGRLCLPVAETCLATKRFSRTELNQDIKRLTKRYQKRGFPGVRVRTNFDPRHSFNREQKTVDFDIEIRERRKVDIVFEGNDPESFPDDVLFEQLTIFAEGTYDDVEIETSSEAIRSYYQNRGYFECNVTWERVRLGLFDRIIYSIDEGRKLKINRVAIAGNKSLPTNDIKDVLKTKVFQAIPIGEAGGYATSLQLEQDVRRIRTAYRSRGFNQTIITPLVSHGGLTQDSAPALAAVVAARQDSRGLQVTFSVDEGQQDQVVAIELEFVGKNAVAATDLYPSLRQRVGQPFVDSETRSDSDALRRAYFSRGYPRAEVATEVRRPYQPGQVVVVHRITENSRKVVGKIAVRGNFKTMDWIIRSELGLREGDPLTVEAAERAQNNLRQSGLFGFVQVDYVGLDSTRQEVVNVLVIVEEAHDNLASGDVSGGYSTDTKLFVSLGLQAPNIAGRGLRGDIRGTWGQERKAAIARLAVPRWLTRRWLAVPFLLQASFTAQLEETQRFGSLESYGTSLSASREGRHGFFQGWLFALRYDFWLRNRDVDLVRSAGSNGGFDLARAKVETRSSSFGPILVIDKRRDRSGQRNPLAPTSGFRTELSAAYAEDFLLGNNRFIKLGATGQLYTSLGSRLTLSNGIRYDHGIPLPWGERFLLPEVERFFAGGDTTVRGFEEDRLLAEVIDSSLLPLAGVNQFRLRPAGGNIRFLHNLELQLNVWTLWNFPVASAIFFDTGLVENSLDGFRLRQLRHAIGIAFLRWVSPVGTLSLEYAVPLDPRRKADNPRGRFHFNFGVLF